MIVGATIWLWAPLAASGTFAVLSRPAARRLPARTATWLLSAGGALLAAAAVVLPLLVLVALVGRWAPLAGVGHWSARLLAAQSPAGRGAWVPALAVCAVQLPMVAVVARRRLRALARAWRAARAAPGPLVVVQDGTPAAFALPGWPGRIVATRGLLQRLTPEERRVVLAHEQAHLDGRHDLHRALAGVAAAANPLLVGLPRAVRLATERWADEAAATIAGDRRLVARTIARVAGCAAAFAGLEVAMGVSGDELPARVRALLSPRHRRLPAAAATAAVAAVALVAPLSAVAAATDTNAVFQQAERAALVATAPPGAPSAHRLRVGGSP